MGLFDQVLGAINSPDRQGSSDRIGQILGVVQQMAGSKGVEPNAAQAVTSIVGNYVRSSLQQQRATGGEDRVASIIEQFSGTGANPAAVLALFNPQQQQEIAQTAAQRTGLSADTVMAMLPTLAPIILNLLQSGKASASGASMTNNPVLNSFLDSDADGDVDIGDALSVASRFLGR
jgi:flagellar motor switch protein FliG